MNKLNKTYVEIFLVYWAFFHSLFLFVFLQKYNLYIFGTCCVFLCKMGLFWLSSYKMVKIND